MFNMEIDHINIVKFNACAINFLGHQHCNQTFFAIAIAGDNPGARRRAGAAPAGTAALAGSDPRLPLHHDVAGIVN